MSSNPSIPLSTIAAAIKSAVPSAIDVSQDREALAEQATCEVIAQAVIDTLDHTQVDVHAFYDACGLRD